MVQQGEQDIFSVEEATVVPPHNRVELIWSSGMTEDQTLNKPAGFVTTSDEHGTEKPPAAFQQGNSHYAERKVTNKRYGYRFFKRAFDIVFSACVIIILFIPGLILCAIIRGESVGSPLFKQNRAGYRGEVLRILKFRTMVSDSDNLSKYLTQDQIQQWKTERKVSNDPRVTKVGVFLRETSLDELPQFINVFLGQMSIVGPRPVTTDELRWFGDNKDVFLSVPPGITGLWQTSARNKAMFENGERQAIELKYVESACSVLDLKLFFSTFKAVFARAGR